jgi:ankyrin repeat protein
VHFAVLSGNADNVAAIVKHSPKYVRSIIAARRRVPISQSLVRIVQVADNSGGLPIHWAAMHGCENAVLEALVGSDGNPELVNRQDDSGMSPLHHAASMNRVAAGLWLLQHGADKKLEDHSSRTPRDVAEQRSYIDFISMMDTHL